MSIRTIDPGRSSCSPKAAAALSLQPPARTRFPSAHAPVWTRLVSGPRALRPRASLRASRVHGPSTPRPASAPPPSPWPSDAARVDRPHRVRSFTCGWAIELFPPSGVYGGNYFRKPAEPPWSWALNPHARQRPEAKGQVRTQHGEPGAPGRSLVGWSRGPRGSSSGCGAGGSALRPSASLPAKKAVTVSPGHPRDCPQHRRQPLLVRVFPPTWVSSPPEPGGSPGLRGVPGPHPRPPQTCRG